MYLCKSCLKVYKDITNLKPVEENGETADEWYELHYCKSSSCSGKVVQVDEMILPTIIELNKKGWNTRFSCSGHLYNHDGNISQHISAYISFENAPPYVSDSFTLRDNNSIYYKSMGFNSSSRPNNLKRFNQLHIINRELYEWAIGLPHKE